MRSVKRFGAAASGLLALAAGCTSVATRRAHDRAELDETIQQRLHVALVMPELDDGSIAPEARELLQAPLTEDSAVKIAILNNRSIRAELARLGVASADLVQAGLLANPIVSANAKFFAGGTEIELGLVESCFDVFFVAARKRVQESQLAATRAHVARELVGIVHDVRRAFVRVRAAQRLVEVELEIQRAAEASAELMAELHRAGNVTDPQRTAEELALSRAKLAVVRARSELAEAREPLDVLLGLGSDDGSWTVDGTIPDDVASGLDLERLESRAITASLDLAELRAQATAEARRAGIVGWEAVLAPGDVGIVAKEEVGGSDWGLGPALGFSLPVFDAGGTRRAAVESRLEQWRALHVARSVEVRSAARRLRERFSALLEQSRVVHAELLPQSSRFVRETLRNYNAMQIGVFEVLAAKQQEIDAAREGVELLRDAWLARRDLEELLAGRLDVEDNAPEPSAREHSNVSLQPGGH